MKQSSRLLKQVDPELKIISGNHRKKNRLDFNGFRKARQSLVDLLGFSDFDDDPYFLVEIDSDPPLKETIRAPSRPVLEHALARYGLEAKITMI